ncbi:hypothetical protein MSAN_01124400 [Mycena sanguinolenta]|uniref:Uncharacterized protein n=1 Tax=Mycena sanguinolenta TaxID=230812 RepID=A0A8H7D6S9_9AGAR|nr:hypothetical protein MSAN_01124400 [Mycena sanguinolenta]
MAGLESKPLQTPLRGYCIFCLVLIVSHLPPVVIEQYYDDTAPLTKAVFVWITDTGSRIHTAGVFCVALAMLGMLMKDAYEGFSRARTGPGALKDGATVPAAAFPTNALESALADPLTSQPSFTLTSKLQLLLVSTAFCAQQIALGDVISELLLGVVLVGMGVTWLMRKRRAADCATPGDDAPEKKAVVSEGNPEKAAV